MELGRFWWWVVLVLVQSCISRSFGCWEQERLGLLRLKASINDLNSDFFLSSWNSVNKDSDCCDWERVKCNITTGRVIQLALDSTWAKADGYLNASLFIPFEEIKCLDLSFNWFHGWIPNEGLFISLRMVGRICEIFLYLIFRQEIS